MRTTKRTQTWRSSPWVPRKQILLPKRRRRRNEGDSAHKNWSLTASTQISLTTQKAYAESAITWMAEQLVQPFVSTRMKCATPEVSATSATANGITTISETKENTSKRCPLSSTIISPKKFDSDNSFCTQLVCTNMTSIDLKERRLANLPAKKRGNEGPFLLKIII